MNFLEQIVQIWGESHDIIFFETVNIYLKEDLKNQKKYLEKISE